MPDVNALPFEVRRYIERQHRRACDANQCDHRATSQNELDAITATVIERHGAGAAWQAQLPRALVSQCHAVYGLRERYGAGDLVEVKLDGVWMLVPRYFTVVGEARQLAAIFAASGLSSVQEASQGAPGPDAAHQGAFTGLAQYLRRQAECSVANCDRDAGGVGAETQRTVNQLLAWASAVESMVTAESVVDPKKVRHG